MGSNNKPIRTKNMPIIRIQILLFEDQHMEVMGFPPNLDLVLGLFMRAVSQVVKVFADKAMEGKLDDKYEIVPDNLIVPDNKIVTVQ